MKSPLSQSQLGVFYACQADNPGELNYQNPVLFTLPESTDILRLKQAATDAMLAHPYLLSHIQIADDGSPEIVSAEVDAEEIVKVAEIKDIAQVQDSFGKTMDILGDRLYRIEIYCTEDGKQYLYIDIHHVLVDGFSITVILKEISRIYDGKKPSGEMLDGAAIAQEEMRLRSDETTMNEAKEWYAKTFADASETDSLPIPESTCTTDPTTEEYIYKHYPLSITHEQIKLIQEKYDKPESIIMQTAFALLLASYTAEEKASYCTAYFGRSDRRTLLTTTMMVHTLPVLLQTKSDTTIAEAMQTMQEQLLQIQRLQYYNYQDAAQDLGISNQVMFVYQGSVLAQKRSLVLDGVFVPYQDLRRLTPGWKLVAELFQTEQGYSLKLGYSNCDYTDSFMREFANSMSAILASMTSAETVSDIEVCLAEQYSWLDKRNNKSVKVDYSRGLAARFKEFVQKQPDAICVVAGETRLTYKQVDELTDSINEEYTYRCGDHVIGYSVPRNEQMVLVPLSIAKAGYTAMPLDNSYPEERLSFMREDASKYEGGDAFVLLYTSGTTGIPKGVMLSEKNFISFCEYHVKNIRLTKHSRYATYAGYGFDAFQHDLWGCLYVGAAIYIITDDIRFDLEGIYQYFLKEKITHSFMTTQMATQMVLNYPHIEGLEYLGTGGEKLMSLDPPEYRLLNAYGPTETTVYVCSHFVDKNEKNIPIGVANDGTELFIVNKYGKRVPWGAIGELLVAGSQVGIGYLNQPERTKESFVDWDGKRVYRTGDIVRYREDGKIEFVGRKDGQVKIRGFRIELKEVEAVIREFADIKDATVQAFDDEAGGKFIAAYIVADTEIDTDALNRFIAEQKPPYMVPAVTMQIGKIPLNQNQKVNKRELPKPHPAERSKAETESSNIPMNMLEEQLHQMVAEIVNHEDFSIVTPLSYAGLSSISAMRLATQIYKRYGVRLDGKSIVKDGTIQDIENKILTDILAGNGKHATEEQAAHPQKAIATTYPLSHSQTGVYFDCMKNPTSTIYNIPMMLEFPSETETGKLRQAAEKVVRLHPELFVHFTSDETGIVQTIDTEQEVKIAAKEMTEEELQSFKHDFPQPFNLQKDLLIRLCVIRTEKATYLLCDMHHLVSDGASYDIFFHQLCDILNGEAVDEELISYAEFVENEKQAEQSAEYEAAREFFQSQLGEVTENTDLMPDLKNPGSSKGSLQQVYSPLAFNEIELFCRAEGITPAHLTLAAVFYTLSRYAATEQVCITTISNGRSDVLTANTIGMFVNTLPLAAKIQTQTVSEFLQQVSKQFAQTIAHENYPFAQIAADYDLRADIMFAYELGVLNEYKVGGKLLRMENLELNIPKFKIAFYIVDVNGQPAVAIEYDDALYSRDMMQELSQSVANVAQAFVSWKDSALSSVSLLNEEQTKILDSFNLTDIKYNDSETIVSLFSKQAELTPDNVAVIYKDVRLTYKEVDERTNAIAALILEKAMPTTEKEPVVSILINRSEWMVIASLAALKAGFAYQPLDPSYPSERLNFMMRDAQTTLLIADEELLELVGEYKGETLTTTQLSKIDKQGRPVKPSAPITPHSLFILLYTSGSTGTPKGVMLEHGNLVAFCHWYRHYYNLQAGDKVAAYASFGFDACMMDMYPALTTGAAVCIIAEDLRLNLPQLNDYFNQEGVTHSFMTTQVGYQFATNFPDNHSLLHLSVGGEKLSALTPPTAYKMYNAYGPTECTIFTTTYLLNGYEQNIPIGKPLDNLQLFVVDSDLNRLPVGAAGELLVTGPQVGRGYLNLTEKTAETFIEWNGKRAYRTGDIVRYLSDGNLQFVGRQDGQVKIRGFRIETKEVEAVIREFPDIKDATVQAFDYPSGGKFIAAYIVSDKNIDITALNTFIRERKPSYMVPAATMQIAQIPLNQNQKVNRKALPAPQIQIDESRYVAPANDTERTFCDIFAGILTLDKVGATDNFFELGGTSLMVTRVIIEANKAGYHVAYGDIFDNPTPRQLAVFVSGAEPTDSLSDPEIENFDYSGINAILQHNNMQNFLSGERQQLGNVLLTGATGYLGIHVLHELIEQKVENIVCLVRGKDQHDAERRLRNLLFYYFDNRFDSLFGNTLHVVNGDVTSDFGKQLEALEFSISTVINCAANVKHFSKGTDIEDVNIGGAKRCVEYCIQTGARLVHVSTTSTGGVWIENGETPPVITEQNIYFSQYLGNQYMHSKFLADRLILDAVAHHGLNAKIMRVGNLAARSYDGEFQANFSSNSYMGRIKVFNMLGCCPFDQYDQPTEFSPINETARAIVLLATTPKECVVFHPYNNHTHLLGDVLRELGGVTTGVRFVENNEFMQAMAEAQQDPKKAALLTGLLAYQDLAHGRKASQVERNNNYTSAALHRLGFYWTDTSEQYLHRMLSQIAALGFFE